MIILHIAVALFSLLWSTLTFLSPSRSRLKTSYGLVALTLTTGTYLVYSYPAALTSACLSGLAYTAFQLCALRFAQRRFAQAPARAAIK